MMHVLKRLSTWLVLLFLLTGSVGVASAAFYVPVVEWNGTHFHVINSSDEYDQQLVVDPVVDVPFVNSNSVAAVVRDDGTDTLYYSYVVDSFQDRTQFFSSFIQRTKDYTGGSTTSPRTQLVYAAGAFNDGEFGGASLNTIRLTYGGVVRGSETVKIKSQTNGTNTFTRVNSLVGYTNADYVYTIVYEGAAATGGVLTLPNNSLATTDTVTVEYAYTSTAATNLSGDIDFVTAHATSGVDPNGVVASEPFGINETIPNNAGHPAVFENLVSIATGLNVEEVNSDIFDMYLLDAGELGTFDPKLHAFRMHEDAETYFEWLSTYDSPMSSPQDVCFAQSGTNTLAVVSVGNAWVDADASGADVAPAIATQAILNNALITNHSYRVYVLDAVPAAANAWDGVRLRVNDVTTGSIIDMVTLATPAPATYQVTSIPGQEITITLNDGVDLLTAGDYYQFDWSTPAAISDYLFVADTGNDRIKVIKAADNGATSTNGTTTNYFNDDTDRKDYYDLITTATDSVENMTYNVATRPMENDFALYTRNDSTNSVEVTWTKVDNFAGSTPTDDHFMFDYDTGVILFGDGNFGRIPAAGDTIYAAYKQTLTVMNYGLGGPQDEHFNVPAGVSARWNSAQGWFDVYVGDTGNNRLAKIKFIPTTQVGDDYEMEWVTSWTTAFTGSNLDSPTDLVVMSDGGAAALDTVFLFACDTGNERVVIYRDAQAENEGAGGTTAPSFSTSFGGVGAAFGTFVHPVGISAVINPFTSSFDIYVADADRNVVVKYQEGDAPDIDCDWTNINAIPYLPTGSYTFEDDAYNPILTNNAPTGSYIKFFYSDTTTAGQASPSLCTNSQFANSITEWEWVFANTPGGTPADGYYYLYAKLYDQNGVFLAEDKSPTAALEIDSDQLIGIAAFDEVDDDLYFYIQNNSQRLINLTVIYPDSVAAVSWSGTFPASKMQITSIEEGPAWQTIQNEGVIFEADWDNVNGAWVVNTSVIGSNTGLVSGPARYVVGVVSVVVDSNAVTPADRSYLGTFDITSGSWADWKGEDLGDPQLNDLNVRIGYLGDIADPDVAYGSVPTQIPTPDGIFGYDDVLVFTLGWNGLGGNQDPISDLGPYSGAIPDLWASPNGVLDVEDLLAFTLMFEWYNDNFAPALAGYRYEPDSGEKTRDQNRETEDFFAEHLNLVMREVDDTRFLEIHATDVEELMAAELQLNYSNAVYQLENYIDGGFLSEDASIFFSGNETPGGLALYMSRLNPDDPGVTGSGMLAEVELTALADDEDVIVTFDLRNTLGEVIEAGTYSMDVFLSANELPTEFEVGAAYPNPFNPTTTVRLAIPTAGDVEIAVFNVLGQRVQKLVRNFNAGYHQFVFDASHNGQNLAAGIYFMKVNYNGKVNVQKMVLLK